MHSYDKRILPKSMRTIQIRLLFKKSSIIERIDPKNYRPISLLNCDYKLMSSILSNRLKPALPTSIDPAQSGIPGRYISEPINFIQSVIHHAQSQHKAWSLIFLDFEKAFDSVDHDFTFKMMKALGLPDDFVRWSKLSFTETSARLIVNGKLSRGFSLPGGGRQGDNLYPLLFAIVMQGLTIAVQKSEAQGVRIPGTNKRVKIKQYVDDSALISTSDADTIAYIKAVRRFEQASGMKVNWDKTDGMYIGTNARNPTRPSVTVNHDDGTHTTVHFAKCKQLPRTPGQPARTVTVYNTLLRYLGIYTGTAQTENCNWNKTKEAIRKTVEGRLQHETTDIGKVINCNPCVVGAANYVLSLASDTTLAAINELDKLTFLSVSGSKPILDPVTLYAQPHQGFPVTKLHTQRHIEALQAKPMYTILTSGPSTDYHYYWLHALHQIALTFNVYSIDDLLRMKLPDREYSHTHSPVHYQVYQALAAFRKIKEFTHVRDENDFYTAATAPLFFNPQITHTVHGAQVPWTYAGEMRRVRQKLRYPIQLLDSFIEADYKLHGSIASGRFLQPDELNTRFNVQMPHREWHSLIASIPQHIKNTICRGNRTRHYDHARSFVAQPAADGTPRRAFLIGDNGELTYMQLYKTPNGPRLLPTNPRQQGNSGDILDHDTRERFPHMRDLKKIKVRIDQGSIIPVDYAIPISAVPAYDTHMSTTRITYANPDATFKAIAKKHRLEETKVLDTIIAFQNRVTNTHPNLNISKLVSSIYRSLTHSMDKKLLFRILHDAVQMGTRAIKYFYEVQHAHKYDPGRIYPRFSILFPTFESTLQFEFFQHPFVVPLWQYTNTLIDIMGLPKKASSLDQALLLIYDLGNSSKITNILNINLIVLTLKAIWDTYVHQMKLWRRGDHTHKIAQAIKKLLTKNYHSKLRYEMNQLPHHLHTLQVHNPYKDARHRLLEREKAVLPTYSFNRKRLKDREIKAYKATWGKTNLVKLEGRQPTAVQFSSTYVGLPQPSRGGDDGAGRGA